MDGWMDRQREPAGRPNLVPSHTPNGPNEPPTTKQIHRWSQVATALRLLAPLWCHAGPDSSTAPLLLLHGFISRREADALLKGSPPGTFLVRFSTSHLGMLAISFVVAGAGGGGGGGEGSGGKGGDEVQHCLVRVTPQGCDMYVEPGRKRYETFQVRACVLWSGGMGRAASCA